MYKKHCHCSKCNNNFNRFSDNNDHKDSMGQSYENRYGYRNERYDECDLYWQGFLAGFYSNNKCNRLLWSCEEPNYHDYESQK